MVLFLSRMVAIVVTDGYTCASSLPGRPLARRLAFRDPSSETIEPLGEPFLYSLLCGPFYFLARGMWLPGVLHLLAVPLTLGMGWLVVPFMAEGIVRGHYRRKGWVEFKA